MWLRGPLLAGLALVPSIATANPAPAGISGGDWRQIQSALGLPVLVQDAELHGHGDPGVGDPGAEAGWSVAVSGDVAVVGAYLGGPWIGLTRSGSAYVFVRSAGVWSLQQELLPSDVLTTRILPALPTFYFGYSVALSGDTIVVGAPGHGAAYVFTRTGATWQEQQKLMASDQGQGTVAFFGSGVSISGETLVVGAAGPFYMGSYQGAAYVFVRTGTLWSEQQKLAASDGTSHDYFGMSTFLEGDTVVVGAPYADMAGGASAGASYVFERSGTTWTQEQKLTASDGQAGDLFGGSVSLSGDTAVVGAYNGDSPSAAGSGAGYVFVRAGTTWSEQQKIAPSDGVYGDRFGISVSVSGDTLSMGADRGGISQPPIDGSAYVFVRAGTTWSEQQKLAPPDNDVRRHFGRSVSLSGGTLVAGAPTDSPAAGDAGSAYVFTGSGASWTLEQKLVGADPGDRDKLGASVSVSGDTAVVGAPFDIAPGAGRGSAYVFVKSGTVWIEQQKLTASDGAYGDQFGLAVSISGDTVVVGAPLDDTAGGEDAGSAYVFVRSGNVWTEQQKITALDGTQGASFGEAVSVSGDTALVGAPHPGGAQAGSAYVYVRSGNVWSEEQKLAASDAAAYDRFGWAVSISGDTALVGKPDYAGAAYAFVRSATVWSEQQKLTGSDAALGAGFGWSVSLSGDTGVVGAPDLSESGPGAAYAFTRSGTVWSEQQKLTASDGGSGDMLGSSVSISGDAAVAGAQHADTAGGLDTGAAYVFVRSGNAWSEWQRLTASNGAADDLFGASVSLSGETAVLGAPGIPYYPTPPTGNRAYVFRPHSADLSVTKTDGQTSAVPGSQVTYSIVVANSGPDNVGGAGVSDPLPTALTQTSWECVASPGSSCGTGGTGGISDAVDLLVGGSATYTLTGTIDPAAVGTLDNTASVSVPAPVTDPNAANDFAQDVDTLTPETDLQLVLADLPDPAGAGGPLTYTVQVTNLGPSVSSGMLLNDALPPELGSVTTVPGPPVCSEAGGTVACNLPGLSPGEGLAVTIRGVVSAGALGTVISNSASVTGNETDPAAGNNSKTELTAVGPKGEGDLVPGTTITRDLASAGGLPDEDLFRMNQQPYSSYEVAVDATSADIGAGSGPALDRLASDATTVLQSALPIGAGASRSLRWENDSAASVSGEYLRVRSAGCTTTCDATAVYRIRSFETTMLVPRFNNGGSQVTILLLQNASNAPISGHARFWSASGALLASQALTLAPRAAFVLNTSTLPGAQGQSGTITLSHDGSYGALGGKAVAVEPATGFTFDTALQPRWH